MFDGFKYTRKQARAFSFLCLISDLLPLSFPLLTVTLYSGKQLCSIPLVSHIWFSMRLENCMLLILLFYYCYPARCGSLSLLLDRGRHIRAQNQYLCRNILQWKPWTVVVPPYETQKRPRPVKLHCFYTLDSHFSSKEQRVRSLSRKGNWLRLLNNLTPVNFSNGGTLHSEVSYCFVSSLHYSHCGPQLGRTNFGIWE